MDNETAEQLKDETLKKRKEKCEPLVRSALFMMYDQDLPANDYYYIERRLRQVIEGALHKVGYNNEKLQRLKYEFLLENIKELKKQLPDPQEFKAPVLDLTAQRDKRCEGIVFDILDSLLSPDLLFSEGKYMEKASDEYNEQFMALLTLGFVDTVFSMIGLSLEHSFKLAGEIHWDGKTREEVTFKQLDKVLKSKGNDKNIPGLEK